MVEISEQIPETDRGGTLYKKTGWGTIPLVSITSTFVLLSNIDSSFPLFFCRSHFSFLKVQIRYFIEKTVNQKIGFQI